MHLLLLLLLLLVISIASAEKLHREDWNEGGGLFEPVRLALIGRQYTSIHVGNPGKTMVMRLRWDQNVSYIYDIDPEMYSDTSSDTSDVFYFNQICLRLPVIYDLEPLDLRKDTADSIMCGGSLGLGPGSDLWRYWASYTVSKYTLTLGGTMDRCDCSEEDGSTIDYLLDAGLSGIVTSTRNDTYPVQFRLHEEFTYVPSVLLSAIENLPEQREHLIVKRSAPDDSGVLLVPANSSKLEFVFSLRLNYVVTPYNARENIVRITETNVLNPLEGISIGRIMLLEDAVLYVDMVLGRAIVSRVYDSFPRMLSSKVASTSDNLSLLSFLSILVWVWHYLETHPMLSQWTKERCFALIRFVAPRLPKSRQSSVAALNERAFVKRLLELYSAIDTTAFGVVVHMSRLLTFWTCYISLAGFRSWRFVERITRSAGMDSAVGTAMFYTVIATTLVITALMNPNFVRRYPGAAFSLMHFALLNTVWLNFLSESNVNHIVDVLISLAVSTMALVHLLEWPFWLVFRLPDWSASTGDVESNKNQQQQQRPPPFATAVFLFVCILFIPAASTFLIVCNVLPTIDLIWPTSAVRVPAALFYFVAVPVCMAFCNVTRIFINMHRETTDKLIKAWEKLKPELKRAMTP